MPKINNWIHGLPAKSYTDQQFWEIECNTVLANGWLFVGFVHEFLKSGDAVPISIAGKPILLVKNIKNQITAFHNVCSHRGYKILKKKCNIKNILRCPYHSWSYNLEGKLVATPHIGGMNKHESEDFDKSSSGLKEVRSYVWLDMIIVNISNNEVSFKEYIKPLNDRWSEFWSEKDQKLIKHSKDLGYFQLKAKCNWKFAIENYCESYHLPWVHPGLNTYSKISDHYHIQGLPNRFAGQGTVVYNPRLKGKNKFPCFPNWPKNKINIAEYVALFPNVMLGIHKDHYYAYWLEPVNYELTIEHMEIYYVGNEAANSKKFKTLRKQNLKLWYRVQSEDVDIIEGMQEGRNSPAYNGGNFSPTMDNPTHHFHKWVATNIV